MHDTERLTSINAVPKVRLRSDDEMFLNKTNSKRNTIGQCGGSCEIFSVLFPQT